MFNHLLYNLHTGYPTFAYYCDRTSGEMHLDYFSGIYCLKFLSQWLIFPHMQHSTFHVNVMDWRTIMVSCSRVWKRLKFLEYWVHQYALCCSCPLLWSAEKFEAWGSTPKKCTPTLCQSNNEKAVCFHTFSQIGQGTVTCESELVWKLAG